MVEGHTRKKDQPSQVSTRKEAGASQLVASQAQTSSSSDGPSYHFGELCEVASALLESAGMKESPAWRTAWALGVAEAWGLASHGLLRLPWYLRRFDAGGSDPRASLVTVSDLGGVVALNGGNGLGHWQVWEAARVAVERASEHGIAAVSVGNSGHCGALGIYAYPMAEAGLIGLVFSNGPAVMPPWGGNRPLLSTSPIAAGIPTSARPAIVDLATSAVARGTIAAQAAAGTALEEGWAFDSSGRPTTDPLVALSGMLAPAGGAKGYALALLVESLTGAMIGPSLAPEIADPLSDDEIGRPQRISHLVIAMDPSTLDIDGRFAERMDKLAEQTLEAGGRLPGSTKLPPADLGDDHEISVASTTMNAIGALARDRGIDIPEGLVGPG